MTVVTGSGAGGGVGAGVGAGVGFESNKNEPRPHKPNIEDAPSTVVLSAHNPKLRKPARAARRITLLYMPFLR